MTRHCGMGGGLPSRGFTLIELMIVVAIITILATMAVPSMQDRVIRTQVSEGIELAAFAKQAVAVYYGEHHQLPRDNAAAGLPPSDRIVGNYVSAVQVTDGQVLITYGNQSNRNLAGRRLSLRPALVEEYPVVPIAWVCGMAAAPQRMRVIGKDETTLPGYHLPVDCRAGPEGSPTPAPRS